MEVLNGSQEEHASHAQDGRAPLSPTIPLTQGTPPEATGWDAEEADALRQAAEQEVMEELEALDQHAAAWPSVEDRGAVGEMERGPPAPSPEGGGIWEQFEIDSD
eukprot:8712613-Alexandrium_andersonii.AAC.1